MKTLPLSNGLVTVVDDDVYVWASRNRWTANRLKNTCYAYRKNRGNTLYLHRAILNPGKDQEIDHIDGDGLNNQRTNLRIVDHAGNAKAHQTRRTGASSRFRGVCHRKDQRKNPWEVNIKVNQKQIYLGLFPTEEEAARAYDLSAVRYFGGLAQLNFPN